MQSIRGVKEYFPTTYSHTVGERYENFYPEGKNFRVSYDSVDLGWSYEQRGIYAEGETLRELVDNVKAAIRKQVQIYNLMLEEIN